MRKDETYQTHNWQGRDDKCTQHIEKWNLEERHNLGDTGVQMNLAVVCTFNSESAFGLKSYEKKCLLASYSDVCEVGSTCLSVLGSI